MDCTEEFKEVKIINVVAIIFISVFLSAIPLVLIIIKNEDISLSQMNFIGLIANSLILSMLIYNFNISKRKILKLYNDFKVKVNKVEIINSVIIILFLTIGSFIVIVNVIYYFGPSWVENCVTEIPIPINSVRDIVICFTVANVLTPLLDELIFRAVVFKNISKRFNNMYIGVIVSSIIFASVYLGLGVIGYFFMGIINCMLYAKYKNILITILINFISIFIEVGTLLIFKVKVGNLGILMMNNTSNNIILGIILFSIGIILLNKFIRINDKYLVENFI